MILTGTTCTALGKKLAKISGKKISFVEKKNFADGELCLTLPSLEKQIIYLHSTYAPQNSHLVELLFTLRELKRKNVTLIMPYFGYGRQDKAFNEGEIVSCESIMEMIHLFDVNTVLLVDPHFHRKEELFTYQGLSCVSISASNLVIAAASQGLDNPLIISPDQGMSGITSEAAGKLGKQCTSFHKKRHSDYDVSMKHSLENIKGKDIVIFDDMISTGSTMICAVKHLREEGAGKIVCACTHGLFTDEADRKILAAGADTIICSDTIPSEYAHVSIAPLLAEYLEKMKM